MLRSIQILRGAAALAVVVHHTAQDEELGRLTGVGAFGVDLFFVISGFIMATTASHKEPRRFLADRVRRILPLWLIALLPWLVLKPNDWRIVATSLTFWPVWSGDFTMPALSVGWSLCFEMLFYLGFALALARGATLPLVTFAVLLLLGPLTTSTTIDYLGSPLALEFLFGILIARMPQSARVAPLILLTGLAWLLLAPTDYNAVVFGNLAFLRILCWGVPAALLVYAAWCLEERFDRRFDLAVLIGGASYAIYLTHPLVTMLAMPLVPSLLAAIMLGLSVHAVIEKPLLRLQSRSRTSAAAIEPRLRPVDAG